MTSPTHPRVERGPSREDDWRKRTLPKPKGRTRSRERLPAPEGETSTGIALVRGNLASYTIWAANLHRQIPICPQRLCGGEPRHLKISSEPALSQPVFFI